MMRIVIAMLVVLAAPLPAFAGNAATLNILGFTPDGDTFVFEEYGVQDGSGFAYANRFYIDTGSDSYLSGTPIRVQLDDAAATVEQARSEARSQGERIVADSALAPGHTAGRNAITELSADPHRLWVNPRPVMPPVDASVEFRLEEIPMSPPERCEALGDFVGFRLVRIDPSPGGRTELIHEDERVPSSRGCPNGYRLGAVQTLFPQDGPPVFAVLIAVRSFGFEGPDHRWMAVAGRL